MKVMIIGSGNVAYHMVRAIWKSEHEIAGLCARNSSEARSCIRGEKVDLYHTISEVPDTADVYLLCISDSAISSVLKELPADIRAQKVIAHTSGSTPTTALDGAKNKGVFYPVQTFTKGRKMQYGDIPFCINGGNQEVENTLSELANSISNDVRIINDDERKTIHLSAVIINNFINHLVYKSEELLEENDLPIELLQPLLKQTIAKQAKLGAYEAQTGPARRKDKITIEHHIESLQEETDKALYKSLTNSIINTYTS